MGEVDDLNKTSEVLKTSEACGIEVHEHARPPYLMKRSHAAMVTAAFVILSYVIVVFLTDGVFLSTSPPPGRDRRAAVAIRDNVTPFQKWGSKAFTWPYLSRYYNECWYFTQTDSNNQHESFVTALDDALLRYDDVDVYLLAHDNRFIQWVAQLPLENRTHLRLVYNTGCEDLAQGPEWLKLGARAYVGHPGVSASPVFYVYFLRRWTRGYSLGDAVDASNHSMHAALCRMNILELGRGDPSELYKQSAARIFGDEKLSLIEDKP